MKRLLPVAAALLLSAAPLSAQVPPEVVSRGRAASTAVAQAVASASAETELPRLNGRQGDELRALWNVDAVLAGRPQTQQGLPDLAAWSQGGTAVLRAYMERQQQRADKGTGPDYQDEIVLGLRFMIHVTRNMQQAALDHTASTPARSPEEEEARKAAIARIGLGLSQIAQGSLTVVAEPSLSPESQRAIAAALAQDVPGYAPMIPPDRRPILARMAEEAAGKVKDDDARGHLGTVRDALRAG